MEHSGLHNLNGLRVGRVIGFWVLIGLAAAFVGIAFQSQYVAVCSALNDDRPCIPISKPMIAGYSVVFFGMVAVIAAPVILALRAESRTDERSSQDAWRAMNYGLLAGFLLVGAGVLVLVLSS